MYLIHGGDWAGYQSEYGALPLDFSANTSPLGLPAGVKAAAVAALETADRYPDPLCRELRAALAERYGVLPGQILCGNGAADLIGRVVQALRPGRGMVTAPTFGEYAAALTRCGGGVREYPLRKEDGFAVTEGILSAITPETDVLFLCQPNNPTGRTVPRELLERILRRCGECGCLLVVDECFVEFLEHPEEVTMLGGLSSPNLLILNAFTKLYGMAGLRLGWCVSGNTELLERMREVGQPWPVSSVAQAAGLAALKETEYVGALRSLIRRERPVLAEGLRQCGCRVLPGEANFLLFRCPDRGLGAKLAREGILIRCCGNYSGLDNHWYRVAVRTPEENQRLLAAVRRGLVE